MKDEIKELLDWRIKDSFILDEMKQKCFKFNGWQYKSKKFKERFRVLCLLEDYANAYYDLKEENERLSVELNKNMIERNNYLSRNEKALDKLYCYGEVFDSKILQQFQKEMENVLQGEDKNE